MTHFLRALAILLITLAVLIVPAVVAWMGDGL